MLIHSLSSKTFPKINKYGRDVFIICLVFEQLCLIICLNSTFFCRITFYASQKMYFHHDSISVFLAWPNFFPFRLCHVKYVHNDKIITIIFCTPVIQYYSIFCTPVIQYCSVPIHRKLQILNESNSNKIILDFGDIIY